MDRKQIIQEVIDYLIKQGNAQSMSQEFYDGVNYTIWEIKKFGGLDSDKKLKQKHGRLYNNT